MDESKKDRPEELYLIRDGRVLPHVERVVYMPMCDSYYDSERHIYSVHDEGGVLRLTDTTTSGGSWDSGGRLMPLGVLGVSVFHSEEMRRCPDYIEASGKVSEEYLDSRQLVFRDVNSLAVEFLRRLRRDKKIIDKGIEDMGKLVGGEEDEG